MEGASSEWAKLHPDVQVHMSIDHKTLIYTITMVDVANADRIAKREYSIRLIPFDQGELVLEDWICSVFTQLYHEIKSKR